MNIRTTTDPITLRDVSDPDHHPYLYEWDGFNGLEIYFETEINRQIYLDMKILSRKIIQGCDSDDYVAL
ncbi:MAG: hypothetical protein PVG22_08635 [Chromatiales bacterium]|jgi:hypothetical protein